MVLVGRVTDLVALPLPEFAFERWLDGKGDDPLTPVLLGFAGWRKGAGGRVLDFPGGDRVVGGGWIDSTGPAA